MRVTSLLLKTGKTVPLGRLSVQIGPNNSGKSQTLRDISTKFSSPTTTTKVVEKIELEKPATFDELLEGTTRQFLGGADDECEVRGLQGNLTSGHNQRLRYKDLSRDFAQHDKFDFLIPQLGRFWVALLDAESRLGIARHCESYNANSESPSTLLHCLYGENHGREDRLRAVFKEIFGLDIRLDYTSLKQFSLRVAEDFGEVPLDPRQARPVLERFNPLDLEGDGYKSFVGVVLSLLFCSNRVILLDEPEAFLHPMQARQLGQYIGGFAAEAKGQIVVATHNASFLAGLLTSSQPVDVFRLNREGLATHFTQLKATDLTELGNSPLLSSQRVLEALFHKGVVVCEADADAALYQTVSTKILNRRDLFFVHAHNRQTLHRVIALMRKTRVPVCAIADLDLLASEKELRATLESLGVQDGLDDVEVARARLAVQVQGSSDAEVISRISSALRELLGQLDNSAHDLSGLRGALNRIRQQAATWSAIKEGGTVGFGVEQECADELLGFLSGHGLYLVPVGELERWMDLSTTRKAEWIVKALECLHDGACDPRLTQFVERLQPVEWQVE